MPKRFCLDCKVLFDARTGRSRCPTCQAALEARMNARPKANTTRRGLGWAHQQRRRAEVSADMRCWICGQPGSEGDPITADHEVPRAQGGGDSPLRPAHRSCNSRRGAQQRAAQP
ncbi:5-methylcytosine-specific restriction endonuclease McrA [Kitasatospora sp. MAP12-15]|uniref:HNH endonuclease n=1 Tax=unclassified Kitasatospora TaxID=2633591 RepID=UPI0024765D15|nr:HNH endonuclease [Kitasatospora sp. MAP12-44]MDH6111932.1 5-methylcytosine-specific restriction endonuclease McrA [Kitasatospora sp. MAP12-44]